MLSLTSIKPNPAGKDIDRQTGEWDNSKLVKEWIDIKNISYSEISLRNYQLQHRAYSSGTGEWYWANVGISFQHALQVGGVIRVHAGEKPTYLEPIDQEGANIHVYTNEYYVWNNAGDTARLIYLANQTVEDQAAYSAPVPEGRILHRYGDIFRAW